DCLVGERSSFRHGDESHVAESEVLGVILRRKLSNQLVDPRLVGEVGESLAALQGLWRVVPRNGSCHERNRQGDCQGDGSKHGGTPQGTLRRPGKCKGLAKARLRSRSLLSRGRGFLLQPDARASCPRADWRVWKRTDYPLANKAGGMGTRGYKTGVMR